VAASRQISKAAPHSDGAVARTIGAIPFGEAKASGVSIGIAFDGRLLVGFVGAARCREAGGVMLNRVTFGKSANMALRVWKLLVPIACFSGCAALGQQPQILTRFSSWAIVRSGELISLSSDSGNIGVGCSDNTMTYMTLVKITDHSSVVWRPDVKAFYFNFTAWADSERPSDFSLLVADRSDAMATGIVILNQPSMINIRSFGQCSKPPERSSHIALHRAPFR
jgi:hypothetical protein